MRASQQKDVSAVQYKAVESLNSQISRHSALSKASSQNVQDWQRKAKLCDKFSLYRKKFVDMLSQLQTMWDGHLATST